MKIGGFNIPPRKPKDDKEPEDLRGNRDSLPELGGMSPADFRNQPLPAPQEANISPADFRRERDGGEAPPIRPEDKLGAGASAEEVKVAVADILAEEKPSADTRSENQKRSERGESYSADWAGSGKSPAEVIALKQRLESLVGAVQAKTKKWKEDSEAKSKAKKEAKTKKASDKATAKTQKVDAKESAKKEKTDRKSAKESVNAEKKEKIKQERIEAVDGKPGVKEAKRSELADKAGAKLERENMISAEKEYFAEYKTFITKNGVTKRLFKNVFNTKDADLLAKFKNNYDDARALYTKRLRQTVTDRVDEKFGITEYDENNNPLGEEKVLEKRNRMIEKYMAVQRFNDVITRAAEGRTEARKEALNERGKGTLRKMGDKIGEWNRNLEKKYGKRNARIIRLLGSTAAASALFSLSGGVGVLGYAAGKVTRGLISMTAGSTVGGIAGLGYTHTIGKLMEYQLARTRRSQGSGANQIQKEERAHRIGNKKAIEKQRMVVELLTGVGLSYETATHLATVDIMQHTAASVNHGGSVQWGDHHKPSTISSSHSAGSESAPVQSHESNGSNADSSTADTNTAPSDTVSGGGTPPADAGTGGETSTTAPSPDDFKSIPEGSDAVGTDGAAPPSIENALNLHTEVHAGQGANQVWGDFKEQLRDSGVLNDPNTSPEARAAIQHILDSKPGALSSEYGFATENASAVIHTGDSIDVAQNGDIVFTPHHGEGIVLAHTDADGTVHPADHSDLTMKPNHPVISEKHTPQHTVHHTPHTTSVDSPESLAQVKAIYEWEHAHPGEPIPQNLYLHTDVSPPAPENVPTQSPEVSPTHSDVAPLPPTHTELPPPAPQADLLSRIESAQSPESVRSILDAEIHAHGVTPALMADLIKEAPHMPANPHLASYIDIDSSGTLPGPAVFLGHDGQLTVYGAADAGSTYEAQLKLAHSFAGTSGQPVNVLFADHSPGHVKVYPDGHVEGVTKGFFSSYQPPEPLQKSVYVFQR